jgi:beta-aspartyl-peptidase (threonine type)
VLRAGGSALDAIEAAIHLLEDDLLFNAGRGAVFTAEGRVELDASIMDGATLAAGAVAGVSTTRHPISAARAVIEGSSHVLLGGEGADAFARSQGLEQVDPSYFFTEERWRGLERGLAKLGLPIRHARSAPARPMRAARPWCTTRASTARSVSWRSTATGTSRRHLHGRDHGQTLGPGRRQPADRGGTYADNKAAAVSCTGAGEYFIRLGVAHRICALVEYAGMSLQAAADQVVQEELTALGGDGGIIAVAPDGQMAWSFNTEGMYRARVCEGSEVSVGVYKDDL